MSSADQVAVDFITFEDARKQRAQRELNRLRGGRAVGQDPDDKLNLVYVAHTRAKLGLVCSRDVAGLLTEAEAQKNLEVGVS